MNIVSKLTLRYLKQNKVRTILTIIGITVSVATVSALGLIIFSLVDNFKEDFIGGEGIYDFRIINSDPKTDAKVNNIRNVKSSYKLKKESIARTEHRDDNLDLNYFIGLDIMEASDSFYDEFVSKRFLVEGRMPRNELEILVPYDMKFMGIGFEKLGNSIYVGVNKALEGPYSFSKPFSINYLRQLRKEKILTEGEYYQTIDYLYDSVDNSNMSEYDSDYYINKDELESNLKDFYVSESNLRDLVNEFSETKEYTIVGYHYGNSENITNNEEFIPMSYHKSWVKTDEYIRDSKNLIFSGQIFTLNNDISENYNLYGIFSDYNTLDSDSYEISKILKESGKENDYWVNDNLIAFKNIFKFDVGSYMFSIVGILGAVILISIVIFAYNIFTSTYVERLKDLGLLKVVGLTNRQLFKMILLDSTIYFMIAVPLGYLLGSIAMNLVFNYVNKIIVEISVISPYILTISTGYIIPIISALFGFSLIFMSNIMSAIFVFKKTPIDALKANNYVKNNYKPKKRRLIKKILGYDGFIASRNIDRNKKRFIMSILSVTMSITMFTVVSNILTYFENDFYKEFDKKEKIYGSVITLDEYSEQLKSDFSNLSGITVESTQKLHLVNLIQKESLLDYQIDNGYISPQIQVVTMNNIEFEKMFGKKDNIYFASTSDKHKVNEEFEITLLPLEGRLEEEIEYYGYDIFSKASEDNEIKLNVIKRKFRELESFDLNGYYNFLFMNEDNYKKLLEQPQIEQLTSRSRILIDRKDYDYKIGYELNALLKKYPTTGIGLKRAPIMRVIKLFVYGFIFLIMSISAINIMNVSYTNTYTRRRELALIKAVGIEDKRLKKIVLYENMISVAISIFLSLILSTVISYLIFNITFYSITELMVEQFVQAYMIVLKAWAIGSISSILLIYIFVSIPYNNMVKDNITEVLK